MRRTPAGTCGRRGRRPPAAGASAIGVRTTSSTRSLVSSMTSSRNRVTLLRRLLLLPSGTGALLVELVRSLYPARSSLTPRVGNVKDAPELPPVALGRRLLPGRPVGRLGRCRTARLLLLFLAGQGCEALVEEAAARL